MKNTAKIVLTIRCSRNYLTHRKFVNVMKMRKVNIHDLKMLSKVRWLSRGECLCLFKLFDLREEAVALLSRRGKIRNI